VGLNRLNYHATLFPGNYWRLDIQTGLGAVTHFNCPMLFEAVSRIDLHSIYSIYIVCCLSEKHCKIWHASERYSHCHCKTQRKRYDAPLHPPKLENLPHLSRRGCGYQVRFGLEKVGMSKESPQLTYCWGSTLFHKDNGSSNTEQADVGRIWVTCDVFFLKLS